MGPMTVLALVGPGSLARSLVACRAGDKCPADDGHRADEGCRVDVRRSGEWPARSWATQRAHTAASSNELDASRLAPCSPVLATSPTAHRPLTSVRPWRSTATPPMW